MFLNLKTRVNIEFVFKGLVLDGFAHSFTVKNILRNLDLLVFNYYLVVNVPFIDLVFFVFEDKLVQEQTMTLICDVSHRHLAKLAYVVELIGSTYTSLSVVLL
jgi:hypothetical protein